MSRGLLLFLVLAGVASAPAPGALRVKASPAVAPCALAAGVEYERMTGRKVSVETTAIGEHTSADGADVVVAADQELNRVIESGATHPDLDVDVARIPWVLAAAPGTAAAPEIGALARSATRVRVLSGGVSREALRNLSLQGTAPGNTTRFDGTRGPVRLSPGEAAIVPLSLAGPGPVSTLSVPPLIARALGVRASTRSAEARAFLDFLAGPGNEAFRGCGRSEAR